MPLTTPIAYLPAPVPAPASLFPPPSSAGAQVLRILGLDPLNPLPDACAYLQHPQSHSPPGSASPSASDADLEPLGARVLRLLGLDPSWPVVAPDPPSHVNPSTLTHSSSPPPSSSPDPDPALDLLLLFASSSRIAAPVPAPPTPAPPKPPNLSPILPFLLLPPPREHPSPPAGQTILSLLRTLLSSSISNPGALPGTVADMQHLLHALPDPQRRSTLHAISVVISSPSPSIPPPPAPQPSLSLATQLSSSTPTPPRPHPCPSPACRASFARRGDMLRHVRSVHPADGAGMKYACETCGKGFARADAWGRHRRGVRCGGRVRGGGGEGEEGGG